MVKVRSLTFAAVSLSLGYVGAAWGADVAPPPTLLIDFLYLGFPGSARRC